MVTTVLAIGLGVLTVAFGVQWWLEVQERRREQERARWRSRRRHGGWCPWSGRVGAVVGTTRSSSILSCPRCGAMFIGGQHLNVLPEHNDER